MSDTTTTSTHTPHADPAHGALAELTGAPAAIYTQLISLPEPVTAAELALAAGVGRSTAGKALTTLEERGLAVRTPGGHDGPRRTPDHWHAAPTHATSDGDCPSGQEPASAQPGAPIADNPEPVGNGMDREGARDSETTPDSPSAPGDRGADAVTAPVTEAPQDAPQQDAERREDDGGSEDGSHAEGGSRSGDSGDEDTSVPRASAVPQAAPVEAITLLGEKKRLAPGALRQMITDYLRANPGEAFTATKISRVIEKSSGAIANALVTLARQGIAEQASDKPRTYRLAASEGNG